MCQFWQDAEVKLGFKPSPFLSYNLLSSASICLREVVSPNSRHSMCALWKDTVPLDAILIAMLFLKAHRGSDWTEALLCSPTRVGHWRYVAWTEPLASSVNMCIYPIYCQMASLKNAYESCCTLITHSGKWHTMTFLWLQFSAFMY